MDRKNFAIDLAALVGTVVVLLPSATGIAVHEWLSLVLFAALFAHCALHAQWAADAFSALVRRRSTARLGKLAFDGLVLVTLVVVLLSGLMVSGAVLPALGLYADGYYFWDPLHAISAKALTAMLLVHVVVHGRWLLRFFRKERPAGSANDRMTGEIDGDR